MVMVWNGQCCLGMLEFLLNMSTNCFSSGNTVLGEKTSEIEPRGAGSKLRECHLAAGQEEGY